MRASGTAVSPAEAAAIALRVYGLEAEASPLPGERDLNFRLRDSLGRSSVLKLHHPDSDRDALDLQDQALLHIAARAGAPAAPEVLRTREGGLHGRWVLDGGARIVRLLSWLEGRPWRDAGPHDAARMADLGRLVAQLDAALADFSHPAMHRELPWNLARALDIASFAPLVGERTRAAVEATFARYREAVAPRLPELPHQVIHNDAHEDNILIDEQGAVVGLIDFGDVIWSPRAASLAVACAYAMQGEPDPVAAITPVVRGYDGVTPLIMLELELLFDLMRTRLAMSICMAAYQRAGDPDNDYLLISQDGVTDLLLRVIDYSPALVHFRFRDACGYDGSPTARTVRQHFESGAARPGPVLDGDFSVARRYGEEGNLGVALATAGEGAVRAPLDGAVHAIADGALVLEHRTAGGTPFWTLFDHLLPVAPSSPVPGRRVAAGEPIGAVAGGGESHLHLQLLTSLVDAGTDVPRAASRDELDLWMSISPDPNLLLGRPAGDATRPGHGAREIRVRRASNLSRALSLSYSEPLHIVRGEGAYLYDADGRPWLDLVNNVCHVGHCHPRVVAAGQRQMALLNTNTRYLHDSVLTYARRLVATLPDPLRVVFFVNSGSEANDLALRLALTHTRRRDVLVLDHAYHGNLSSLIDLSPYKFNRPGGAGRPATTHVCDLPDPYRGRLRDADATGEAYAADVRAQLAGLDHGPAAFFAESLQSCGGQIVYPPGYLRAAFAAVREAGGVCVADEVQVGFGRVGRHFWGFELQDALPDIVTMGKPIGNGHPVAAVVTTPQIAASFVTGMEYFNTFGGNPVSAEIGLAVLDVLRDERLQAHAVEMGRMLMAGLRELQSRHPLIGQVRGEGLFIGVELTLDRDSRAPATEAARLVKEAVKARGALISTDGPDDNVLKLKPPMVISGDDCAFLLEALDQALAEVAEALV